jgi:23S rRNA pseudouridine1911/1915/1917 synthase
MSAAAALQQFDLPAELAGERADTAVAQLLGMSRSAAALLCSEGNVVLVGRGDRLTVLRKADRVQEGARLRLTVPERPDPLAIVVEPVDDLKILLDDDEFVAIDKPVGVAAHPSPGWVGPTVVGALAAAGYRISTSGAAERAGIVHRLDVGTSGVMVVAKTEHAYTLLKRAFKERTVDKVYHAVVQGLPDPLEGTIDAPIGRHPGYDWRFAVIEDGRPSVTHYEVLEAFGKASLVEVHLETGRTHQIRVHAGHIGHPVAGDDKYGDVEANRRLRDQAGLKRMFLHASTLEFALDGGKTPYLLNAPLPLELIEVLDRLV